MVACGDRNLNPGFHGCVLSALPLSLISGNINHDPLLLSFNAIEKVCVLYKAGMAEEHAEQ